jgi:3',5'-nucleoside bisphosphate phosphatase
MGFVDNYSRGLLDFHTHSTYSDGGDNPYQLVQRAKKHGVSAMALTDHHNNTGLEEFQTACMELDIFPIPFGTEISAELPENIVEPGAMDTPDLIILGKNPKINPFLDYQEIYKKDLRNRHVPEVIAGLKGAGFTFPSYDLDDECRTFKVPPEILHSFIKHGNNLEHLVKHVLERDSTNSEAEIRQKPIRFVNKYFYAIGCPAYAKRVKGFNTNDAIALANAMNCLLIVAHPGGEYGALGDRILDFYIKKGIKGIEARNYFNNSQQNEKFDELAKKHNLIRSGGSDCHGDKGSFKIGNHDRPQNQLPKEILEELWDNLPD